MELIFYINLPDIILLDDKFIIDNYKIVINTPPPRLVFELRRCR